MTAMLEDTRQIKAVYFNDLEESQYMVGSYEVDKIEVYPECGMHCDLPFVAVYKNGEIHSRIPAYKVQIVYA